MRATVSGLGWHPRQLGMGFRISLIKTMGPVGRARPIHSIFGYQGRRYVQWLHGILVSSTARRVDGWAPGKSAAGISVVAGGSQSNTSTQLCRFTTVLLSLSAFS